MPSRPRVMRTAFDFNFLNRSLPAFSSRALSFPISYSSRASTSGSLGVEAVSPGNCSSWYLESTVMGNSSRIPARRDTSAGLT